MSDTAPLWPPYYRQKTCWQCAEPFACGPGATGDGCWCDRYPPTPILYPGADCVCPTCLAGGPAGLGTQTEPAPIPSPCVLICRIAPDIGLCVGCLRTLEEIAGWSAFTDQQRQTVFDALRGRSISLPPTCANSRA